MNLINDINEIKPNSMVKETLISAGYKLTETAPLSVKNFNSEYGADEFLLNNNKVVYRKGKTTHDRPGAFLALWQRPLDPALNGNKPIPFTSEQLNFLIIEVSSLSDSNDLTETSTDIQRGIFVFPTKILIKKGIVSLLDSKGKTGFRVFPPWSQDRGTEKTKVFSNSGKKTQAWQLPYFLKLDEVGNLDRNLLGTILSSN